MTSRQLPVAVASLLLCISSFACSDDTQSSEDDETSTSEDSTDTDSTESDSSDSDASDTTPLDTDTDTDTDSTDTAGTCELEFEEAAPGTSSTITIRNERDSAIYIPFTISTCTFEPFAVYDGDVQYLWYDDAYIPKCTEVVEAGCEWGCSDGPTQVIRLEPGAEWEVAWGLYVWAPIELDEACAAESDGCEAGATCWAGREWVEDGPLTAQIRVSEACSFDECECGSDACTLDLDSITAEEWEAEIVELEFDAGFVGDISLTIE
ncbi:hypothetical protein G6O69_00355 [Pseudenhygromyxa sp. WMMC2535]|uniref:hypothetical protein n=1 Tax=Pseudenhygromyxa sp. WMMC2535 TaxID=2712867 RepID=UPI00159630C4|nr:hypothetical protein [Pseudenhygromyxa sp. WMMC2535]NVB36261.1 hypothetical protein [Pseudenhygromyxa sp. WMMC2535]